MNKLEIGDILKGYAEKKYILEEDENTGINICGVRSNENQNKHKVADVFNDFIYVLFNSSKGWILKTYEATTIPGEWYFRNPMNSEFGTAIIVPGQYVDSHALGMHFSYPALVQIGRVRVYRDKNRDSIIDTNRSSEQNTGKDAGINIHYSDNVCSVGRWSAGCQVLHYSPKSKIYNEFLDLFRNRVKAGRGNKFSYTLFEENDFS